MQGTRKGAVLWDMDGVLVDNGAFHYQSWQEVLGERGIPFNEELFRRTFGMNNTGVLQAVMGVDTRPETIRTIGDAKEAAFRKAIRGRVEPLPGVMPWLRRLGALGYQQAVASSAPQANIDAILAELGIRAMFQAVISAADLPGKPDPTVFLKAAEMLGVPPGQCTVMEDAIAGVQAAKRAGMRCLAVTTTNTRQALEQAGADLVVGSLVDLPEDSF